LLFANQDKAYESDDQTIEDNALQRRTSFTSFVRNSLRKDNLIYDKVISKDTSYSDINNKEMQELIKEIQNDHYQYRFYKFMQRM